MTKYRRRAAPRPREPSGIVRTRLASAFTCSGNDGGRPGQTMRFPTFLRTWLRPVIGPIRAAMERRVAALVDARVSQLADRPITLGWQARSLRLVDEQSHPN